MKFLSAAFDALLVAPAAAVDLVCLASGVPTPLVKESGKSFTREQIEKVEEDLGL